MIKKRKISYILIILALVVATTVMPLTADADDEQTSGRTVRVACGMNDALYLDESGEPAGICLPYLRQLAWTNNWNLEYVEGSYSEGLQNLKDSKVDMMFPVSKEDDTDGSFAFTDFIGGYQQVALFAKDGADIYYEDYGGFDGKRVGLSIGSNSAILDEYAKEHGFTYTPVELNTVKDKVDALNNGDIDMVAVSTLNQIEGGKLVAVLNQVPFYFCTNRNNTELISELNFGMSNAMINAPNIASDMFENMLTGNNRVSYTKEENEKIKNTDKIAFGVYSDCLPLAGVNSDGECVGIYVDTLKELAKESGLNIEIKPIKDSNKLYSYMDDGTVDFVIGLQELRFYSENADNYLASNGIYEYTTVAVSMPEYQFEEDDEPVFALTKARNFLEEYIDSNFENGKIKYYDTRKDCLDAVCSGDADATFLNTWEYNYETKNPRFQELMEWESYRITSVFGLGGTRTSDLELLSILEKTISQIPESRISDIIASNLDMAYDSYDFADRFYQIKTPLFVGVGVALVLIIGIGIYLRFKRRYINDLVAANNAKSDFLSRMSHELRTPLNAIKGYAEISKDSAQSHRVCDEDLIDNMDNIESASQYLLGIIKDILDIQQMETGRISLELTEINLAEYMSTIVNMVKPMASEKNINFTYDMINGAEGNFTLDGLKVQQVLLNLLYNAVKFTDAGGKVILSSRVDYLDNSMAKLTFTVSDTGIGMSREFMETKLFQKFAQENENLTSPYEGCGNGLVLCKKFIDLMGGEISCESEQGKGAKFTVVIETSCRQSTDAGTDSGTATGSSNNAGANNNAGASAEKTRRQRRPRITYDLGGVSILMCEDNEMNQDMERRLLERMNCKVEIAGDGQIGLDKFASSEEGFYDIVLMDIRMPNMNGLDAAKGIRALERQDAKIVPILAVSANAFEEDIKESLDAGMNEHLAKPINAKLLYEKIKEYCK